MDIQKLIIIHGIVNAKLTLSRFRQKSTLIYWKVCEIRGFNNSKNKRGKNNNEGSNGLILFSFIKINFVVILLKVY